MRCSGLNLPKYIAFHCYSKMACSFEYYGLASIITASNASVLVPRLSDQDQNSGIGMYLPIQMDLPSCLVSVYVLSLPVSHWLNFNREDVEVMKKTSSRWVTQERSNSRFCSWSRYPRFAYRPPVTRVDARSSLYTRPTLVRIDIKAMDITAAAKC
jgi:hypothetical protein